MIHRSAPPTERTHSHAAGRARTRVFWKTDGAKEQWGEQLGEARRGKAAVLKDDSISMRTREVRRICISQLANRLRRSPANGRV